MDNDEAARTLYCGNLDSQVDEELLYELFIQAGPLQEIKMPQDRYGCFNGYCYVIFQHDCTVPYAMELFEDTELFGKFLKLRTRSSNYQKSCSSSSVSNYAEMDFDALLQLSKDKLSAESSGTGTGLPEHSGSRHHMRPDEPVDEKKSQSIRDQDNRLVEENRRRSGYHHHSDYHHLSRRERESYSRHGRHGSRNQLHRIHQGSHDLELSNQRHRDNYHSRRRSHDKYHNDHGDKRSVGGTRSNKDKN